MGTPSDNIAQRFYGNVMYVPVGQKVQTFPPHNYATTIPFTYLNPASLNYQLLTPYWTDTSDGQVAGWNSYNGPIQQLADLGSSGGNPVQPGPITLLPPAKSH